jgi:error-prone DNA polymerase
VPLFQEQLLRIAMSAAGFSGGEAEELRRAMGFQRSRDRMQRLDARLREGMTARGIAQSAQDEIVHGINSFALYGFPESHAASFALIAYASAWLKAHHPQAFLAGLLNAQPMGFYSPATLVKDAQRHGVVVLQIDVTRSLRDCTLETDADGRSPDAHAPAVRIGLRYVAGLRGEAADRIATEQARAPLRSIADLAQRAALRRDELDALAECGALTTLDPARATRRSALWQVAALGGAPGALLRDAALSDADDAPLDAMSTVECTTADYRTTGMTIGPHWMAHLRNELATRGVSTAAQLRAARHGMRVRTAGHVIVRQRPESASGFCFLTLEDETGMSNAVLTPDVFRRVRAALHASSLVEIEGRVQNIDGVVHVRVATLHPLSASSALPASHDYR